jgi:FixJ family two-component response regulator
VIEQRTIVAVLDDEAKMRVALKRLLSMHGFDVALCDTWDDFVAVTHVRHPDCLLLDLHMPRYSGFDVLGMMESMRPPVPTVVITGRDEPGNQARARSLGAVNYLLKPLDESILLQAIHEACLGSTPHPPCATDSPPNR